MLRMEPSAACDIPGASGKPAGAQGKYGEFPPLIHLPRCCFEKRGMDMARMPDGRALRHCPDVMDITEMCRVLDISTKTGYRLLKNGHFVIEDRQGLSDPQSPSPGVSQD